MTGRRPARLLCGLCLAAMLASCAGGGVHTAADAAAASAAGRASGAGDGSRGNPGAPGADPAGNGGTDTQAGGNPGAPGDVAVFEEAGVPYSVLKGDADSRCAGGVCTLLAPVVGAGNPDDVGGVDECIVRKQSDIRYDPPAQGGLFRRGATVRATVDCTVQDSGTTGTQTTDATRTSSGSSDTSGGAAQNQVPADRSQG